MVLNGGRFKLLFVFIHAGAEGLHWRLPLLIVVTVGVVVGAPLLVGLDALVLEAVDAVVRGRDGTPIFKVPRQVIVLADQCVDLLLDQAVLLLEHPDVVLQGLRLAKQVQVHVVAAEVGRPLLLNFALELFYDVTLLGGLVSQAADFVADLPSLLLHDEAVVLNALHLCVLAFELLLDGLLLALQLLDLLVEFPELLLLPFNFLVVVCELLLSLSLFFLGLGEFLLRIEKVVLGLAEGLLGNPALPLLVALRVDKRLQLRVLLRQLALVSLVVVGGAVHVELELLAAVGLALDGALRLVDFLLALSNLLLNFVHFFVQVGNGSLLEVDLAASLLDLTLHAFKEERVGLPLVGGAGLALDLLLLLAAELGLEGEQLLPLLRVELLTLAEMSDLDHELLLVHLSLHVVEHGDVSVVEHLQALLWLRETGRHPCRLLGRRL